MNFSKLALFTAALLVCWLPYSYSQSNFKFGIRGGLNISTMLMDSEVDDNGKKLEENIIQPRVVVGPTVTYKLHERFSLSAELLFIQKGSRYRYEGVSYMQFPELNGQTFAGHQRIMSISIVNGYIEMPILFQFEPINDKLQLEVGASAGVLISSRGIGVLKYTDEDYSTNIIEYDLDFRYLKDSVRHVVSTTETDGVIDGITIDHPSSVGAYYFNKSKSGSFFKQIDVSANVGASYMFSKTLKVGARASWSLLDITNNAYDVSYYKLDAANKTISRKDFDRNFGVQLFIGLQF